LGSRYEAERLRSVLLVREEPGFAKEMGRSSDPPSLKRDSLPESFVVWKASPRRLRLCRGLPMRAEPLPAANEVPARRLRAVAGANVRICMLSGIPRPRVALRFDAFLVFVRANDEAGPQRARWTPS